MHLLMRILQLALCGGGGGACGIYIQEDKIAVHRVSMGLLRLAQKLCRMPCSIFLLILRKWPPFANSAIFAGRQLQMTW